MSIRYIVGIDFGHGETTANVVELLADGTYSEPKKLSLKPGGVTKIRSFYCKYKLITDVDYNVVLDPADDNLCNRIKRLLRKEEDVSLNSYFKVPIGTDKPLEQRFGEFVNAVYNAIVNLNGTNTTIGLDVDKDGNPTNFLIYAACPSGWSDEQRDRFADFLRTNDVKCKKVFKESDAAWVSFMPSAIDKLERPKTLVVDYGSSTIDLTWSEDEKENICNRNSLGASRVENDVFDYLIKNDKMAQAEFEKVKRIVGDDKYFAKEIIKLAIRKMKENFYDSVASSRNETEIKECEFYPVMLATIFSRDANLTTYFGEALSFDMVDEILANYITEVKKYFVDFRREHMEKDGNYEKPEKIVLTGGASRMMFVAPMINEIFEVEPIIDVNKASESISEGVALAGAKDYLLSINLPSTNGDFLEQMSIVDILEAIKTEYSNIGNIKSLIKTSIKDNFQKRMYDILCPIFDVWQRGEINMDTARNLNLELKKIAEREIINHKNDESFIWENIIYPVDNYDALKKGNVPSLHSLFYSILNRIDNFDNFEGDELLYHKEFCKDVSKEIIDNYYNSISKVIDSVYKFVRVFAPMTSRESVEKLFDLEFEYIDFTVKIDRESKDAFLTALVRTAYNLIQQKDSIKCSCLTLNKNRGNDYRNGYFSEIKNDFDNFSKTLVPEVPRLEDYARQISSSVVDKIQEIQDYCTQLQN